jgi:murein DD-endopeptidase MepM/ murein hydrolase activator NlpD
VRAALGIALALLAVSLAGGVQAEPTLEVNPPRAKPGDALLLTVQGAAGLPSGTLGDRPLAFFPFARGFRAVAALPIELEPGAPVPVAIQVPAEGDAGPGTLTAAVGVEDPHFRETRLKVANRYVEPPPKVRRWIKADQQAFNVAFAQPFVPPLFQESFDWPRQVELTSHYGDQRVFNGTKKSQHYGLDLQGKVGDPILAVNDGQVVMVRRCYASGGSMVIHHGAGIYSVYFHLSRFQVKEGQTVRRGEQIGLVGKTGRATGPHLHWSMKVAGLYVDPESMLRMDFK